MKMKNLIRSAVGILAVILIMPAGIAAGTWDGGGGDAKWDTLNNWDDNLLPASGADVTFGSAFTSGATITLNGNRTVGLLTYATGATRAILQGSTITINTGITRTVATTNTSDLNSAISLPSDIVINNDAAGLMNIGGAISGAGKITFQTTSASAVSLGLGGNNASWSGGLTMGTAAANSSLNLNSATGLGTGDILWQAGTVGPSLNFNADVNYTINNNFMVNDERIINPYNISNGTGKTIVFNGKIDGSAGAAIRFVPRQTNISGAITELNGVNTNADSASRMVFYGSTNDSTSALGNTYVIGNNAALGWGRIILGQASVLSDEVAFLYKDGITISHEIELNDSDSGPTTMGVTGTNASAIQSGDIVLKSFTTAKTKNFSLFADVGSTYTVSGKVDMADLSDTLNLTKTGNGIVALNHATGNVYTGSTTVSAGTLLLNNTSNSATGTGAVTVASGATLGGAAILAPSAGNNVTINGTLSPGNSPGTMEFNLSGTSKLDFGSASTLAFDLGTSSDLVDFTTAGNWLSGSGNATLALTLGSGFSYANTYTIFSDVTTAGFTFAAITGYDNINQTANFAQNGNNYELSFTAVPEPATIGFLALAGFAMVGLRRRRTHCA